MELSAMEIINGGVERDVLLRGTGNESVLIRQLPLRLLPEYGRSQGDESKLIELFTGKPPEWVENLAIESAEMIVTLGDDLNLDPFVRWSQRRLGANERIAAALGPLLPKVQSALRNSAPPSAPAASTPSPSSAS